MALARARRDRGINYWPGFVDALSTLVLGIIFLLIVFVVVQFYLSQEVTGKDTALSGSTRRSRSSPSCCRWRRPARSASRSSSRNCARASPAPKASATASRASTKASAAARRDAQGKVDRAHRRSSTPRSSLTARALAQVEVLNQQIAALRRQLAALEERARSVREEGQGFADPHRRSRPAAQRGAGAARAGTVALPLRFLRPAARDPRQPSRHPHRRRPLRVPVGSVLRHRPGGAQAGRPRRARQDRERAARPRASRFPATSPGCCASTATPTSARSRRAVPHQLGPVGGARDRGGAVPDQQGRVAAAPGRRRLRRIPADRPRHAPRKPTPATAASS